MTQSIRPDSHIHPRFNLRGVSRTGQSRSDGGYRSSGRKLAGAVALAASLIASGCVPSAPQPTPAPTAQPVPAPAPAPAPAPPAPPPAVGNWIDAPQTPGDWSYRPAHGGGMALFGTTQTGSSLTIRCNRAAGVVEIGRAGRANGSVSMRIRTETAERTLAANAAGNNTPAIVAQVPAADSLLDAMAFSRGRFAVDVPGTAPIYVPAWPEVTRVVEDCR